MTERALIPLSRRSLLRCTALAMAFPVASGALGPLVAGAAAAPSPFRAAVPPAVPATWKVRPFPLAGTTLADSVFTRKRQLVLDYLENYDTTRFLAAFKATAGLDAGSVPSPAGWESFDGDANSNLRGHYTGHFLSASAQAFASTGDPVYDSKLNQLVNGIWEAREALRRPDPWVQSIPGRFGTGIQNVTGSYQYVSLPAAALGTSTAVTIALWVRPLRSESWSRAWDFGKNDNEYMYLTPRNGAGVPRFAITSAGGPAEKGINGTAPLPLNTWSHVAVTLAGGTATMYVNGAVAGSVGGVTQSPATFGAMANNWLGRSNYPNDPVFAGGFDELNIYDRALTAAEVSSLASTTAASSSAGRGTVSSYDFQETGTATLADGSGNGRDATLKRTWGAPSHPGFVSAYPETQFITLESMTASNFSIVWAPYYTIHKILAGLLDAHLTATDPTTTSRALDLAAGLCDWMYARLSVLPAATRQRMWSLFSSGEFGGVQEAIVGVHTITRNPQHLALAKLFDLNTLIDACAADTDILNGLHANQHIPIFNGLIRLYDVTDETRYLTAARNFWPMVTEHRMYAIGGTSQAEFFQQRDRVAGTLAGNTAETCCAHNMLKLSRLLYFHDQDPRYMEYYERALYNQILGSKQDAPDSEFPLTTYLIGLSPGSVRNFKPYTGTTCCEGTGIESATKYQDSIYFRTADDTGLHVNLFIPSTLDWGSRGVTVTQRTAYPVEQGTTLEIGGSGTFALNIRRPGWARAGYRVSVNGSPVDTSATAPGTYLTLNRTWQNGDKVSILMPFTLRLESPPDDRALRSVFYGPIHLVARNAQNTELVLSLDRATRLNGDLGSVFTPVAGSPLHFRFEGIEFAPFMEGTTEAFHSYLRNRTTTVTFAGDSSGVPNRSAADGSTFLDEIWSAAPFTTKADFIARTQEVCARRVANGTMTRLEQQKVLLTAGKARVAG